MEEKKKKSKLKIIILIVLAIVVIRIAIYTSMNKGTTNIFKNEVEEGLKTSQYVDLKGIYVDKSDEKEHPDEALIYVLYTVKSNDKNIKFYTYMANNPGTALTIKINNVNEYKDTIYGSLKRNFKDTGYENLNDGQSVLSGTSMNCIGAFRVSKNDLKEGGIIQLTLKATNSFEEIFECKTDDVQYFDNAKEILKNADYETYEKVEKLSAEKLTEVEPNLKTQINNVLKENYYYWYISTIKMQIEFDGNNFIVKSAGMSNGGTYEIRNKVILLHYNTGITNEFAYEFKDGKVSFVGQPE